jgi:hypothetical protein
MLSTEVLRLRESEQRPLNRPFYRCLSAIRTAHAWILRYSIADDNVSSSCSLHQASTEGELRHASF